MAGNSQENLEFDDTEKFERYSYEYSQNVEAKSEGSNELKYLLGERIDEREFQRKQHPTKRKTMKQKLDSIEAKFLQIYNRQGHYSASQSLSNVFGDWFISVLRFLHCVLCCKCAGCCQTSRTTSCW